MTKKILFGFAFLMAAGITHIIAKGATEGLVKSSVEKPMLDSITVS